MAIIYNSPTIIERLAKCFVFLCEDLLASLKENPVEKTSIEVSSSRRNIGLRIKKHEGSTKKKGFALTFY